MAKRTTGKNIWIFWYADKIVFTGKQAPNGLKWEYRAPAYNRKRVTGDSYRPYYENTDWANRANQSMADEANYNFRRKNNNNF